MLERKAGTSFNSSTPAPDLGKLLQIPTGKFFYISVKKKLALDST